MEVPTISLASCWEPNANAMLLTILPLPGELTPRRRISSFWKQLCEGHNENCFNVQNVLNGFRRFIKIHPLSNLDKLCHVHKHRHCLFWVVNPSAQRKVPSPSCFLQSEARSLWDKQPGLFLFDLHMATNPVLEVIHVLTWHRPTGRKQSNPYQPRKSKSSFPTHCFIA